MNRYFRLTLFLCGQCLLYGCGGGGNDTVSNDTIRSVPLVITSGTPPSGTVEAAYAFSLTASGGKTPYTWKWAAAAGSSLPPGLNLSNGSISGMPATAGSYDVVMTVTDSGTSAVQ